MRPPMIPEGADDRLPWGVGAASKPLHPCNCAHKCRGGSCNKASPMRDQVRSSLIRGNDAIVVLDVDCHVRMIGAIRLVGLGHVG
ncbi:hypothetical protein CRG98_002231 [Punica granatum]|uniref:Uncharacterized protein n=1 Tax=Punica granatum TaxID=22663 RepID=A0A2I0LAT1_PUNGR|nr:hypothetical protein CRG98_002231 [Punica granatum]